MKENLAIPQLSREEFEALVNSVCEVLTTTNVLEFNNVQYYGNETYGYIPIYNIDLDSLASSLAGITDPLGQLRDWFTKVLNSVASWIVQQISGLLNVLEEGIESLIKSVFNAVKDAINTLASNISTLTSTIKTVVIEPITKAIEVAKDFISSVANWLSQIGDTVKSIITSVGDWINQYVVQPLTNIVDQLINTISQGLTNLGNLLSSIVQSAESAIIDFINKATNALSQLPSIISEALSKISEYLETGLTQVMNLGKQLLTWLQQGISNILNFISQAIQPIKEGLTWIGTQIENIGKIIYDQITKIPQYINELAQKIVQGFEWVGTQLENIGKQVLNFITQIPTYVEGAVKQVMTWLENVGKYLEDIWKRIVEGASWVVTQIENISKEIVSKIVGGLEWLWGQIQNVGKEIFNFIANIPKYLEEGINWIIQQIQNIGNFFKTIWVDITKGISTVTNAIRNAMEFLSKLGEYLVNLPKEITNLFNTIKTNLETLAKEIEELPKQIENFINMLSPQNIIKFLTKVVADVEKFIWEHIPKELKDAFKAIIDWIKSLPDLGAYLVKYVEAKLEKDYPQLLKDWEAFAKTHPSPWDWFKDLPTFGVLVFRTLGAVTWELMPESIREFFENLVKALQDIGKFFDVKDWFTNFINWLGTELTNVGKTIWGAIQNGISWFMESAKTLLTKAYEAIVGFTKDLMNVAGNIGKTFLTTLYAGAKEIANLLASPFRLFYEELTKIMEQVQEAIYKDIFGGKGTGEFSVFYHYFSLILPIMVATIMLADVATTILQSFKEIEVSLEPLGLGGKIKIGLSAIAKAISKLLRHAMPDVIRYLTIGGMIWWMEPTRVWTRYYLTKDVTIELPPLQLSLEGYRRLGGASLIPSTAGGAYLSSLDNVYKQIEKQLRFGGIWEGYIRQFFFISPKLEEILRNDIKNSATIFRGTPAPAISPDLLSLVVADRFNQNRALPLSLYFKIPSISELARWLVRDVFLTPAHYEAVVTLQGYTPDLAKMQYMYSFEYPPPEKIWRFVMRGISGLLWFSPPKEMVQVFNQEAEWLGAGKPKAPVELNYGYAGETKKKAITLFKALNWYMKWRQYSNFSWFRSDVKRYGFDFTADSWLVLDVTADIPTKIDVRWMGKWGLFDIMANVGIKLDTPSSEFISKILSTTQTYGESKEVYMDLTMMCRLLQATGLHPHYVPIVAVAEIMNALSDERTLLRTGFIDIYREGMWDVKTLDQLLSGFVVTTFNVAYFDLKDYVWKSGKISIPVMYLPPERKLLELRATFDKAMRLVRRLLTGIFYGLRNYIVTPDEGLKLLSGIVEDINANFFVDVVKSIVGKELALQVEEGWAKVFMSVGEVLSNIYAIGRARGYARYLLWSVIRFVREGYMTLEQGLEFVDEYVEVVKEHKIVKEFLKYVFTNVHNVFRNEIKARAILNQLRARRISFDTAVEELLKLGFDKEIVDDYIYANVTFYHPSLTQYGTLLEIVPEAMEMSLKAILNFNLPTDELPYWLKYIARKPFSDELTLLRTRIYNLLGLGATPQEIIETLKDYLIGIEVKNNQVSFIYGAKAKEVLKFYDANRDVFQAFGITPMEWVMYNLLGILQGRLEALRQAGRERVPSPTQLMEFVEYLNIDKKVVEEALKEYGIASKWIPYYVNYIYVRTIADDVRRLLTYMVRAKALGVVSDNEWKDFEKLLQEIGYNANELKIVEDWVNIEERIYWYRAYMPTPLGLATLSEYIKIPEDLIKEVLERRRVPKEWVSLWLEYIKVRPLANDINGLLTSYRHLLTYVPNPPEEIASKVKKYAELINFTTTEWDIFKLRATIDRLVRGARYLVPSPFTLARMYAVLPEIQNWLEAVIKFYSIPQNFKAYIEKYMINYSIRYELRRIISSLVRLYEYFAIDAKTLEKLLSKLKNYGLTDLRIRLIMEYADLGAKYRAYEHLIGTPRTLVSIAEYVPKARDFAIKRIHNMIDALPIDEQTKKLLKEMWEDYVRIRPVYDEVRRYVTELISDYAYGVIDDFTLKRELNQLKKWGLDDYEIQFYIWLAQRRRERYKAREERGIRGGYYGYYYY